MRPEHALELYSCAHGAAAIEHLGGEQIYTHIIYIERDWGRGRLQIIIITKYENAKADLNAYLNAKSNPNLPDLRPQTLTDQTQSLTPTPEL